MLDVIVQEVDKARGRIGLKLVAKHENGGLVQPRGADRAREGRRRPGERRGAPARRRPAADRGGRDRGPRRDG